jgi:hypothetical protein
VKDLEPQENEEIDKLKNNESTGENGIPAENQKYIGGKLKRDEKTEDPEQTKIGLTDMRNKISTDGRLSESFGVRQGDPLSTMLFNRVLEAVFTFQR